jgi:hypothetical protein
MNEEYFCFARVINPSEVFELCVERDREKREELRWRVCCLDRVLAFVQKNVNPWARVRAPALVRVSECRAVSVKSR